MLSHESVLNYYNTNFQLMQHHNYSLEELENMMPWEREFILYHVIAVPKGRTGTTKTRTSQI